MSREELLKKARVTLTEAVKLDKNGQNHAAIDAYANGVNVMMKLLHLSTDDKERAIFRTRIESYIGRAETLRFNGRPMKVEFLTQYRIDEDSIGHTYEKIFSCCLDEKLNDVSVEDPYIIAHHQVMNFVMFCEMLVTKCNKLKSIRLVTSPRTMMEALNELGFSLNGFGITLTIETRDFHDREIRFNNGWLVKIGRGLDIYKTVGKYKIGSHEYHFRPCKKTIADIFKIA